MHPILHHGLAAAIATVISAVFVIVIPPHQVNRTVTRQVTHSVYESKHAWPDLTDAQKAGLAGSLKVIEGGYDTHGDGATTPKHDPLKIEIICGDGACTDLAQDIDDAAELAKVDSVLDRPAFPLGYGIGVVAEAGDTRAAKLALALEDITGLKVDVIKGHTKASGYPLWISIGKRPLK